MYNMSFIDKIISTFFEKPIDKRLKHDIFKLSGNVSGNVTGSVSDEVNSSMTIKDIAEYCGVSVSTVSRALNNHPDVSKAVRARVMEAVKELHFVPNNTARDLVKVNPDAVGLIIRGVGNLFFAELLPHIEATVSRAGYTPVLHQIRSGDDELRAAASLARSKKLAGIIFLGGRYDYSEYEVMSLEVPFVCCSYTNGFGELDDEMFSSVSVDDEAEAYKAVKYLLDRGHRKIAVLLDKRGDRSVSELRYRGYQRALGEAGIEEDEALVLSAGSYDPEDAYRTLTSAIKAGAQFTALFVICDSMAIAAMKALHECGRRVPDDCSVIAIDGIGLSSYTVPTLTTLIQPKKELGETSVRVLLDMIDSQKPGSHITLQTSVREGGSVAEI